MEQHEHEHDVAICTICTRDLEPPISIWRILEVTIAFTLLFGIAGAWVYGWLRGTGLLAALFWYRG